MRVKITIVFLILVQTLAAQPVSLASFQPANTAYDELNPVISPDGKTLFVTIANHPQNIGGKRDPGDIWMATLTETGQWSNPVHAGLLLNDRGYNGVAGFSADGTEIFLLSHYDAAGTPARTQGISVSHKNGDQWSRPENIAIPYFQNKAGILGGYIMPDKSAFVFSAETYGSQGVEDIYVSLRNANGKWSEPKNLGVKINTQFQELSPSLSGDGKTLYFSSNGRRGHGSFDIYAATRLDDSWSNWADPVNLSDKINSEGRELYYRMYPELGFSVFTSTKNSDGYGDVKLYRPDEPILKDSAAVVSNPIARDTQQTDVVNDQPEVTHKIIKVYGKVINSKSGEGVSAKLTFQPSSPAGAAANVSSPVTSSVQGYSVSIPSAHEYSIKIEAPGFISIMEKLDIKTYQMASLEMDFQLQPIAVGTTVNLKNVLFEQSKTTLLPASYAELDWVVSFLQANPNVRIELAGHTDNRGIPAQNVKLSQARVDRVKEYLVSKGISPKRINGKGYGGSKPIASNDTEETRKLNRRVEFTIKKS